MDKTPMTELLEWLGEKEYSPLADHIRKVFLEREKEFAEKCWDAGEDFGVWLKADNTHYPKQVQTKQYFLNQLYPGK